MIHNNHFTTKERIKAKRVLNVLEELGREDQFFADAWCDFDERNDWQIKYLIEIYDDWYEDRDSMSLETAVRLCAYE